MPILCVYIHVLVRTYTQMPIPQQILYIYRYTEKKIDSAITVLLCAYSKKKKHGNEYIVNRDSAVSFFSIYLYILCIIYKHRPRLTLASIVASALPVSQNHSQYINFFFVNVAMEVFTSTSEGNVAESNPIPLGCEANTLPVFTLTLLFFT